MRVQKLIRKFTLENVSFILELHSRTQINLMVLMAKRFVQQYYGIEDVCSWILTERVDFFLNKEK